MNTMISIFCLKYSISELEILSLFDFGRGRNLVNYLQTQMYLAWSCLEVNLQHFALKTKLRHFLKSLRDKLFRKCLVVRLIENCCKSKYLTILESG